MSEKKKPNGPSIEGINCLTQEQHQHQRRTYSWKRARERDGVDATWYNILWIPTHMGFWIQSSLWGLSILCCCLKEYLWRDNCVITTPSIWTMDAVGGACKEYVNTIPSSTKDVCNQLCSCFVNWKRRVIFFFFFLFPSSLTGRLVDFVVSQEPQEPFHPDFRRRNRWHRDPKENIFSAALSKFTGKKKSKSKQPFTTKHYHFFHSATTTTFIPFLHHPCPSPCTCSTSNYCEWRPPPPHREWMTTRGRWAFVESLKEKKATINPINLTNLWSLTLILKSLYRTTTTT